MKNYLRRLMYFCMFSTLGVVGTVQANEGKAIDVVVNQQQEVVAVYDGYSANEGYKFTLEDGTEMLFQTVTPEVLKTFDLTSDDFKSKKFKIKYTTTKDENGEYKTIVGLENVG